MWATSLLRILTTGPIRWRLTIAYLAIIWLSMTVAGFVLSYLIERQYTNGYQKVLASHTALVKSAFEEDLRHEMDIDRLSQLCEDFSQRINARIQVHDPNGNIIADSAAANHPDDPAKSLKSFSCVLCHPEARSSEMMVVRQPLVVNGTKIGDTTVSVSMFAVKQAAATSRRIIFIALVIAAALAAILSQRLAFSISKPITDMSSIAKAMAGGDLNQRATAKGTDEVSHLANAFNGMASQIQKMLDDMADERDRMETILTTMADGIIVTDKNGKVILFNKASEQMFGLEASHAVGRPIEEIELHPELAKMVSETLTTQRMVRKDLKLPGNNEITLSAYSTTVKDPPSTVEGAVVVLYDLSEIRKHERAQKEFVANVSHELRTPITAVRVTAEALLSGAKNDPNLLDRFLTTLVKESERLSLLIDDLLEIAKREAGRRELQRTEVDVREVVERAVSMCGAEAERSGVDISVEVPDIVLFADERQFEQVLSNLIDNAVKYTPEGGHVTVRAEEDDKAVSVCVADTGIGIPKSDVPRIFERFYRVDKARSRQAGGTGLGLSIVKDIVDAHDGTITVDTRLNEGSIFTVTFPKPVSTRGEHTD